jgi:tetratricopeptide (TPR) repeat protein
VIGFADQLFANADYFRAATEYRRFLYFYPDSDLAPLAALKIGLCLVHSGRFTDASVYFLQYPERYQGSPELVQEALYQSMYASFLSRDLLPEWRTAHQKLQLAGADPAGELAAGYLAGWCYLREEAWQEAADAFAHLRTLAVNDKQRETLGCLQRESLRGARLPRKQPLLAGALAALVPGSGRMYLGDYGDGGYSLLVIGVTGLLAWRFYQTDHEKAALGWGGAAAGFYLGDVYGSLVGAVRSNRERGSRHLRRIESQARREGWMPAPHLHYSYVHSGDD